MAHENLRDILRQNKEEVEKVSNEVNMNLQLENMSEGGNDGRNGLSLESNKLFFSPILLG